MSSILHTLYSATYLRKIHPIFDPNFYFLIGNLLVTGFYAYFQHWTGKDALQILIINISISIPFALLIYIYNPQPHKRTSRLMRILNIVLFLIVGIPLVTLVFFMLSFFLPFDVPAAFEGKTITANISLFYTSLFIYIGYAYSQFTVPTIAILVQHTFLAVRDYLINRNALFVLSHPLSPKVLQYKLYLPVLAFGFYILASTPHQYDINRDSFTMWFILGAYSLLSVLFYLNDFYNRNRQ